MIIIKKEHPYGILAIVAIFAILMSNSESYLASFTEIEDLSGMATMGTFRRVTIGFSEKIKIETDKFGRATIPIEDLSSKAKIKTDLFNRATIKIKRLPQKIKGLSQINECSATCPEGTVTEMDNCIFDNDLCTGETWCFDDSGIMTPISCGTPETGLCIATCPEGTVTEMDNCIFDNDLCTGETWCFDAAGGMTAVSCSDCEGVVDECGVCNGDSSSCLDCNGDPNGGAEIDACNDCGYPGNEGFNEDCLSWGQPCENASQCFNDYCDVCNDCGNTNPTDCFSNGMSCESNNQCAYYNCDCSGVCSYSWNEAEEDICGVCGGDNSTCSNECGFDLRETGEIQSIDSHNICDNNQFCNSEGYCEFILSTSPTSGNCAIDLDAGSPNCWAGDGHCWDNSVCNLNNNLPYGDGTCGNYGNCNWAWIDNKDLGFKEPEDYRCCE